MADNWRPYNHPFGPAWTTIQGKKAMIVRHGPRYVLYEEGNKGLKSHHASLDEAKKAHEGKGD
jgi:hypothetical protein